MRLYDLAAVMRSKNAGPFTLTIDMIFDHEADFDRVLGAATFSADRIAELYRVPASQVKIHPFKPVLAVKVSLPRPETSSGAPGDRDVYGCQQHFPLGDLEI